MPAAHRFSPPQHAWSSPQPLSALLWVLAYFGLQVLLGLGLYPIANGLTTHPPQAHQDWAANLKLWATCLDLVLASAILLPAIHRRWPSAWTNGDANGLGFTRCGWRQALLGAITGCAIIPLLGSWITWLLAHGQPITEQIDALILQAGPAARIPLLVLSISLVPITEETLFRGVLLSALRVRYRRWLAVSLTSSAFALAHLGSFNGQWYALPALALFAWALAELRIRCHSIWPGVIAHGCNNLIAMIAILTG